MSGPQPFTYASIDAWSRLMRREVSPHEVKALLMLDLAMRHPEAFKAEDNDA